MSLDEEVTTPIVFKCTDGVSIAVDRKIALSIEMVKALIDSDSYVSSIELTPGRSEIVKKILAYQDFHIIKNMPYADIEKPIPSKDYLEDNLYTLELELLEVTHDELFEMMITTAYLGVPEFMNILNAKLATLIMDKSVDELRKEFNIKNDFTPEEYKVLQEEVSYIVYQ